MFKKSGNETGVEKSAELQAAMAEAKQLLGQCEKGEAALRSAKEELQTTEKDHKGLMEQWQTECALQGEVAEPAQIPKLGERVGQLKARIAGLKENLATQYVKAAATKTRLDAARSGFSKAVIEAHQVELQAARDTVTESCRCGLGLEIALGERFVSPEDQYSKAATEQSLSTRPQIILAGGFTGRRLEPLLASDEIAEPRLLSEELGKRASRRRSWQLEQQAEGKSEDQQRREAVAAQFAGAGQTPARPQ